MYGSVCTEARAYPEMGAANYTIVVCTRSPPDRSAAIVQPACKAQWGHKSRGREKEGGNEKELDKRFKGKWSPFIVGEGEPLRV